MLRIIGGTLRGRRFPGPEGRGARPTAERVREAIASALTSRGLLDGARVLDLYAGTGALAFEALSRGAAEAWLVDVDRRAERALRESARRLGLEGRAVVRRVDLNGRPEAAARGLGAAAPFDLVFADPPYEDIAKVPPLLLALAGAGLLAEGAVAVVEHATRRPPALPQQLAIISDYRYGDTSVVLLELAAPAGPRPGEAAAAEAPPSRDQGRERGAPRGRDATRSERDEERARVPQVKADDGPGRPE